MGLTLISIFFAVLAHAILVGLILGLSTSPIASIFLPILLGIGGYKTLDAFLQSSKDSPTAAHGLPFGLWASGLGVWSLVVTVSLLVGIYLRTGQAPFDEAPRSTLSYVNTTEIASTKLPSLVIVCAYYDQLSLSPAQKRVIARAVSMKDVDLDALVPVLEVVTQRAGQVNKNQPTTRGYGVFETQLRP